MSDVKLPSLIEKVTALPTKVKIGQKVQAQPLQKFAAAKGQEHIISFLDNSGTPFRLFYVKKAGADGKDVHMGSIHHTPEIAKLSELDNFNLYYFLPILEYTIVGRDSEGRSIAGKPYSFKYMQVKDSVWASKICGLLESVDDPTATDFKITLTPGKEQWQDMIINPRKSGEAVWRKDPEYAAGVTELVNYFDSVIRSLAGKDKTTAEVLQFFYGDANQQALNHSINALPSAMPNQTLLVGSESINLDDFTS